MPTAQDFQESECPLLWIFRNLNAHSSGFSGIRMPSAQHFPESEGGQLWIFSESEWPHSSGIAFTNLNASSALDFQESECPQLRMCSGI